MSKLLDLFSENSREIYHKFPTKDNKKIPEPFVYLYPDSSEALDQKIKNDSQLDPGSVSVERDKIRIKTFQKSNRGERFIDIQKILQRQNTWAQTRNYRIDSITEHTEPLIHKPRHGFDVSIFSLKSKDILLGYENNGKLQGETSDYLLSSTGPVYVRMNSKSGMLNQRLSLVDIASANVRGRISSKINKWLEPINRVVSDARSRISDNTIDDRPEIEFDYIKQVYDANKGVLSGVDSHKYGHIYFPVESSIGTYQDSFSDSPGFKGYKQLGTNPIDRFTFVRNLFEKISNKFGGFLDRTLSRVGLGPGSFLRQFLPKARDINLLRNIKRLAGDIDRLVNDVINFRNRYRLEKIELVPTNLREKYEQSVEKEKIDFVYNDAQKTLDEFKRQVSNYLNTGKRLSIGSGVEDGTVLHTFNSIELDENGYPNSPYLKNFRYKDLIQLSPTIFKKDIIDNHDVDSVNVIFQTVDTENELKDDEVRFRAFISDINEVVVPTYNENKYVGRYETFYTYNKVVRDISFILILQAFSKNELKHINEKLSYLTSLAYPISSNNYLTPNICKFTIGNLYFKQPCILYSLNHTIDNDSSWDIDEQLPMSIGCTIQLRLLDKELYNPNTTSIYSNIINIRSDTISSVFENLIELPLPFGLK